MLTFNFNKVTLPKGNSTMLDIGCGEGRHVFGVMQNFKNNLYNKRAIDLANAFVSPNGLEELIKISKASSFKQIQANMNALLGFAPLVVKNNQTQMDQEKMIKKNELELSTGVR